MDLVGNKLREVFKAANLVINWYDHETNLRHFLYAYEKGKRITVPPVKSNPASRENFFTTGKPFVVNSIAESVERKVPGIAGVDFGKSLLYAPIIGSDKALGLIGIEDFEHEKAFGESDIRLVTTVAASLGTALENARLFDETQRLFKAEQERVAELQIINSIQQGLASKLDFASIIDLVGEQVRTTTKAESIFIALYDKSSGLVSWPYWVTNGERVPDSIEPLKKNITRRVLFATAPLNLETEQEILAHDAIAPPGYTTVGKSFLGVPFKVGNALLGALSIHAVEQEHAFAESDERLLQTIANAMSVALENVRLFDETQRLFKAEQERVAELQIINSIQQGLAAELDFQAIVDLVGDKLREVFNTPNLNITWYDEKENLIHYLYIYEYGKRKRVEPQPPRPGGIFETLVVTRQP
ncbi:MAG TPA: GAF domain-containing protein, partial [Anaerolineales bacterium]|nr:GAF domain-containing protein [Anaerolineales bacterium]